MAQVFVRNLHLVPSNELADRAFALARRLDHPVYDCTYLALVEKDFSGQGKRGVEPLPQSHRQIDELAPCTGGLEAVATGPLDLPVDPVEEIMVTAPRRKTREMLSQVGQDLLLEGRYQRLSESLDLVWAKNEHNA